MPAVYCYDWAVCIVCWLVIRADLAENDSKLKHNDRAGESKRGGEVAPEIRGSEKDRDPKCGKSEM